MLFSVYKSKFCSKETLQNFAIRERKVKLDAEKAWSKIEVVAPQFANRQTTYLRLDELRDVQLPA